MIFYPNLANHFSGTPTVWWKASQIQQTLKLSHFLKIGETVIILNLFHRQPCERQDWHRGERSLPNFCPSEPQVYKADLILSLPFVICHRKDTMLNFFLLFTTEINTILNHSCNNNLSKYFLGDVMVVQACKNIKEGEEVCQLKKTYEKQ